MNGEEDICDYVSFSGQ